MKSVSGALALAALMVSPSLAGFVNGGFESNNFSGWSYRWGKTKYGGTPGKWAVAGAWENDVVWSGHRNWDNLPNDTNTTNYLKAAVVNAAQGANTYMPAYGVPPNGTYHLLLNYKPGQGDVMAAGSFDVTQFRQKTTITATDVSPNGKYYVFAKWAAILENPALHMDYDQPGFLFKLGVKHPGGAWTYIQEFHSGDQQTLNGWVPTQTTRNGTAMFGKKSFFMQEVALGDEVSLDISVIDCGQSAHGAFAYLDFVGTVVDTTPTNESIGKPCIYGADTLNIGSRVKLKGDFGSGKGINIDADAVDTGNGWAMGRIWMRDRSKIVGNATYKISLIPGNGSSVTGSKSQKPGLFISPIPVKVVTPGLADQGPVYVGNTLTIPPGQYRNVTSWGGSIKLTAGVYHFKSLTMTANPTARLILDNTNGPIEIRIAGDFDKQDIKDSVIVSNNDYINKSVSYYATGNIHIFSGVNKIWGNFDAPAGTLTLDSRTIGGYAHAKRVMVNSDAVSTCKEAPASLNF